MKRPARFVLALSALALAGAAGPTRATNLFVTNHVNSNEVQGMAVWKARLAMATLGGIVTYDPATGEFEKILQSPAGLPSNRVLCVEVSPSGSLWAGTTESGVARIKPDGTFRRTLSTFDGLPGDRVQTIYVRNDSVWVGTNAGAALLTENPGTGRIGFTRSYTSASTSGALAGDDVRAFLQVGDTLWCATTSGLSSFASGAWQLRTAALSLAATSLAFHADTLWAATALGPYAYVNGAFQARNAGHAFTSQVLYASTSGLYSGASLFGAYRYGGGSWSALNTGLPSLRVTSFRETAGGDLWTGTQGGLARLVPTGPSWEAHRSPGPLVNGTQRAIVDSRGVWIGTGNFFPPVGGRGVVLHFDGLDWSALTSSTTGGSFQQTDDFAVLSDRSGKLWFGHCCSPGPTIPRVDRWDPATDTWDRPPAYNIWALEQSPAGPVYGASSDLENGVYVFDASTGALTDSLTPANSGLTSSNLRAIRFDSAGKGWIGTAFNGL
ncbi:MAG: hypothetical protein HY568_02460, partial [Candidatus Latescibacteria bacterium]|nr:hypothetical protein [Candidatus Latescibacterota bacterium]